MSPLLKSGLDKMAAEIFPIFIMLFESRCDSQAPYVVKQYQEFGFLDVNLMVESKISRLMEQTKTNLQSGNNLSVS